MLSIFTFYRFMKEKVLYLDEKLLLFEFLDVWISLDPKKHGPNKVCQSISLSAKIKKKHQASVW